MAAAAADVARVVRSRRRGPVPARTHAYAALHAAIVRCELVPGQKLTELELAAELGVSRTPVREAVGRLRDEGLVEIVPQLGTFVVPISPQTVREAEFIRDALECAAIREAAERATAADRAELEAHLELQRRATAAVDADRLRVLDDEFHELLCSLSGCGSLWPVVRRAKAPMDRVAMLAGSSPEPTLLDHEAIVTAVAQGDGDVAEAELRRHLRAATSGLDAVRADYPDYFEEP
jgi:GntR family transcriptional regulator, rspAB operon transcriptional repressor